MVPAAGQAVLGAHRQLAAGAALRHQRASRLPAALRHAPPIANSNRDSPLTRPHLNSHADRCWAQQKRREVHTNPFHHSDRFSITPPPHATKPASDPQKYIPNHSSSNMNMDHANRLPLYKVPRNIKRSGMYTMKVGEDHAFRAHEAPSGMDKQLFELPEYPSQGRRFTDVLRHFSAGFRPEDDNTKPQPQDVFEDAPLYSSFTKDNVFPKMDDTAAGALGVSKMARSGRRSKSAMEMAPISNAPTLPSSDAIESRASRGGGGGGSMGGSGGNNASFQLSERGAAASPVGGYSSTYIRAPSVGLSQTKSGGRSPGGVRAGGLQMMLSGQ